MLLPLIPTVEGATCQVCGRAVPYGQNLCPHCGARMPGAPPVKAGGVAGSIALGCIALLVGSFGTCFSLMGVGAGGDWTTWGVMAVCALIVVACVRGIINRMRPR